MCPDNDSNYSPHGYPSGNWQGWEIMIVVLMLIGLALPSAPHPGEHS